MSEYERQDAPHLPSRDHARDIGGSLAEHVRRYPAVTSQEISARDHLADIAERGHGMREGVNALSSALSADQELPGPPPEEDEVWETLPTDTKRVLCKDNGLAEYNGGLWTVTYPDRDPQQFGHAYFLLHQGPFRPVPPGR